MNSATPTSSWAAAAVAPAAEVAADVEASSSLPQAARATVPSAAATTVVRRRRRRMLTPMLISLPDLVLGTSMNGSGRRERGVRRLAHGRHRAGLQVDADLHDD